MEGSHLLALLKTLQPDECQAFGQYATALLTEGKKGAAPTLALIRLLLEVYPDFPADQIQKPAVYARLYPGKTPVSGKLEKQMVEVNKLLKEFLLHRYSLQESFFLRREIDWLSVLKERRLDQLQQQALNRLAQTVKFQAIENPADYHRQFQIEFAVFQHQTAHNLLKGDLNVPNTLQALDIYYYLTRLELLNHFLLQRKVTTLDVPGAVNAALQTAFVIPEEYLQASATLLISYKIYQLLRQELPEVEDFQALADLLRQHEAHIGPEMLKQFYTYLRNFCTLLINAGKTDLLFLYHRLQRDNLERGYLYYDGNRLSASAYISVATGAIRCQQFDWALEFIEIHKGRVIGDNDTFDLYRLNLANYTFATGDFEAALDLLPPVFDFLNYTLLGKRLELKILYELNSELLPYKAGAFKIFITRASQKFMPANLRRPNSGFVNVLIQLAGSKPGDPKRSERLTRRILNQPHAAERDWLLEKAAKL